MIFYVNGIRTGEPEAQCQAEIIGDMVRAPVTLLYNPTSGFIEDLKESFWNKWLWWYRPSKIVRDLAEAIQTAKPRYLIGHSQGCMIILNAVRSLPIEYRWGLRCILFASPKVVDVEHVATEYFANEGDQVIAHIIGSSLNSALRKLNENIYTRPGGGHDLIESYIEPVTEFGDFEQSMFAELIKNGFKESHRSRID